MRKQNKDLFLVLLIAIMNVIWACFPVHVVVIALVLALPLIFLAPGYLLIELLTQKREHDGTTHLLLSIGLSLSIDILGGFLLNVIPMGLTTLTWSVFLGALTIACALLCIVKRRQWRMYVDQQQKDLPTRYEFLLLTLTIYVVIFAFMYTTNSIVKQRDQGFTQFWLLLDDHQPPLCAIQLGIDSSETVTTTYQVEVKENNQRAAHWSSITLAPQQKWQGKLPLAIKYSQTTQLQIEADLYRQQDPRSVYRTVQLILSSSKIKCARSL
jgi:uncharacterized membrane protein